MTGEVVLQKYKKKYPWPRRRFIRGLLSFGIDVVGGILTRWEVSEKKTSQKKVLY